MKFKSCVSKLNLTCCLGGLRDFCDTLYGVNLVYQGLRYFSDQNGAKIILCNGSEVMTCCCMLNRLSSSNLSDLLSIEQCNALFSLFVSFILFVFYFLFLCCLLSPVFRFVQSHFVSVALRVLFFRSFFLSSSSVC